MPDAKQRMIDKKIDQFRNVMKADVEVATNDEDIIRMCEDIDNLFVMPVGNKVWTTFEDVMNKLKCKKVVFFCGTGESRRCPAFVKSNVWDAYWSERPLIKEYMQSKNYVDKKKPYIVGCNVYELKCPYTVDELMSMKDTKSFISACRFGSSKGSSHALQVFDQLLKSGVDANMAAWGWLPNEAGISFLSLIKSDPVMFDMWNDTGKKMARGAYTAEQIPEILGTARLSLDLTAAKGDGNRFGDGGLQYGQAESIDWGALPFCDSNFYIGDEWDTVMLRQPRDNISGIVNDVQDHLKTWNPEKHAKMIEAGRQYVRENMSRQRFNDSMNAVLTSIV
jgi:hypothetical protein